MINCIIFDCDGTLVDSENLFNRALSHKLKERSIELSADQLVARFRGVKFATVLSALSSEYKVELGETFAKEYRALVQLYFKQELKACEGVADTLPQIEVAMCVASNGPLAKMQLAISVTGLAGYFGDDLFSAYEVDSWKPDPGLFLNAAKKMGFKPAECLVLEDSAVGIKAAEAAGMKPLLYDPNHIHTAITGIERIHHFSDVLSRLY